MTFESRFGLDSDVTVWGLKARVLAVKFTGSEIEYRVRFATGGADAWIPDEDVQ